MFKQAKINGHLLIEDAEINGHPLTMSIETYLASMGELNEHDLPTLANMYVNLKQTHEDLERQTKKLAKVVDMFKSYTLPEAFEKAKSTSLTTEDGYRLNVQYRTFCQVEAGATVAAHEWLRENGWADLIKPTVNASSLASMAKEVLGTHDEDYNGPFDLPDEIFKVTLKPQTSVTKVKK